MLKRTSLFIIKTRIPILIKCSYDPTMFIVEPWMVSIFWARSPIYPEHMSIWYLVLDPQLNYHRPLKYRCPAYCYVGFRLMNLHQLTPIFRAKQMEWFVLLKKQIYMKYFTPYNIYCVLWSPSMLSSTHSTSLPASHYVQDGNVLTMGCSSATSYTFFHLLIHEIIR